MPRRRKKKKTEIGKFFIGEVRHCPENFTKVRVCKQGKVGYVCSNIDERRTRKKYAQYPKFVNSNDPEKAGYRCFKRPKKDSLRAKGMKYAKIWYINQPEKSRRAWNEAVSMGFQQARMEMGR